MLCWAEKGQKGRGREAVGCHPRTKHHHQTNITTKPTQHQHQTPHQHQTHHPTNPHQPINPPNHFKQQNSTVTSKFNELVYQYPIRIPERYSLVIRSLLTQEGICLTLKPEFHFLEVAYPYVARRLLTDADPALRDRLVQVLFQGGKFQWARLTNLIQLAREGTGGARGGGSGASGSSGASSAGGGLDLSETVRDALRLVASDAKLRAQLVDALTEGNRLHVDEAAAVVAALGPDVDPARLAARVVADLPALSRQLMLSWADRVLVS